MSLLTTRYEVQDFSGALLAEVSALRAQRPAFAPLISNHQLSSGTTSASAAASGSWLKVAPTSHSSKVSRKRVCIAVFGCRSAWWEDRLLYFRFILHVIFVS